MRPSFVTSLALATLSVAALDGGPASASCPTAETVVTCARYADRLVIQSAAGKIVLRGSWSARLPQDRFTTSEPITIDLPGPFDLPLPGVGTVTVTCSPYLAIEGELDALPALAGFWPELDLDLGELGVGTTYLPKVAFGMALGEQLDDVDEDGEKSWARVPVDACSPYLYFMFEDHVAGQVGDVWAGKMNDEVKILVNPFDPSFIVQVAGAVLDEPSMGLINKIGLGVSRQGIHHWESVVDLPAGVGADAGRDKVMIDGHVWSSGKYGLLPIPGSPVQLYVDGDAIVDLGPWPQIAEEVLTKLGSGEAGSLHELVADYVDAPAWKVLKELAIGGNLIDLAVTAGPYVSITVGGGSFAVKDGALRFAAEVWTPGEKFWTGETGDSAIDALMGGILITSRGAASGYVDADGYRFELEGDYRVGPLDIVGAKLVIDSQEGITVTRPDLDFDPVAFLNRLHDLFGCDFRDGVFGCKAAGFDVLSVSARIVDGEVVFKAKVDILGVAGSEFRLVTGANGVSRMVLQVSNLPWGGFSLLSAKLTINPQGVKVEAGIGGLQGIKVMGEVDKVAGPSGGLVRYTFSGQGTVPLAGFDVDAAVTFSNASGVDRVDLTTDFLPSKYNPAFSGSSLKLAGRFQANGKYELTGKGSLKVADYPLAQGHFALSNKAGKVGFSLDARFDAEVVHVRLLGLYNAGTNEVLLTGTSDLTVEGYTLTATAFTLSSTSGLTAAGTLKLGGMSVGLMGRVTPAGAVSLTGSLQISIPVLADLQFVTRALECGTVTIERAGQCGTKLVELGQQYVAYATETVHHAWECGTKMVEKSFGWLTGAAQCLGQTVECGWQMVADGAQCGFQVLAEKIPLASQCAGEMIKCSFEAIVGLCDPTSYVPDSCREVATPKTCPVYVCQEPTCWGVTEWESVPEICESFETVTLYRWETITQEVPEPCYDIVPKICDPEVIWQQDQAMGTYQGGIEITLGSTLAGSVYGSYCPTGGACQGWSMGGSLDFSTGQPRACVGIPREAFPDNAFFDLFTWSGAPIFCQAL